MIPKLVHILWFSGEIPSKTINDCMNSIAVLNPNYDVKIWTLYEIYSTFEDIPPFFDEAIELRKWAFASDWARLAILEKFGGIYVDADVLCHKSFDSLSSTRGFMSWESNLLLGPHVIGSTGNNLVIRKLKSIYDQRKFRINDNVIDQTPMPDIITQYAVDHLGLIRNGLPQTISEQFKIYAADVMTSRINDRCVAEHLYVGAWLDDSNRAFADDLAEKNRRFLKRSRKPFQRLRDSVISRNYEKKYAKVVDVEQKKSLILVNPVNPLVPNIRFWHLASPKKAHFTKTMNSSTPLISVIVPVYNVEDYIKRCLSSIKNQSYKNIEVIIVNDGSTDQSSIIVESFTSEDSRFKLFDKPNGGLGSARNFGLDKMSGEFVCFVDSDDWIAHDFVQAFVNSIDQETDIVVCNHEKVLKDGRSLGIGKASDYFGESDPISHILMSDFECYAWNKLFRSSIFENPKIRFSNGWFEDFAVVPAILGGAREIAFTNKVGYFYTQRSGSIISSTKLHPEKNLDIIDAARSLIRLQTLFKPKYWSQYYDWKLIKHILFYRLSDLNSINDEKRREYCITTLAKFLNAEFPWWHETPYVVEKLSDKKFDRKLKLQNLIKTIKRYDT